MRGSQLSGPENKSLRNFEPNIVDAIQAWWNDKMSERKDRKTRERLNDRKTG